MRGKIETLRKLVERYGVRGAVYVAAYQVLNRLIGYYGYDCIAVPQERLPQSYPKPTQPGFTCREIDPVADLEKYVSDPDYLLDQSFLEESKRRGDRCFGVYKGDVLVRYGFFAFQPTDLDDAFCFHFPKGWVYIYKGLTHPQWRGARLQGLERGTAFEAIRSTSGFKGFVGMAMSHNLASLKSNGRLGFRTVKRFHFVGQGKRPRLLFVTNRYLRDFRVEKLSK